MVTSIMIIVVSWRRTGKSLRQIW